MKTTEAIEVGGEAVPAVVKQLTDPDLPAIQTAERTITPAQAKVEAVASLTMTAYSRASQLQFTPDELARLQGDFPDEAFRDNGGGKRDAIYVEHAHLRDRLNSVLGFGQWAIIPRSRWAEDFEHLNDRKETIKGIRIYVEAMLVIRGCFVGEAIGDMAYYPNNLQTNYGDAVEGAKTAALRRCVKELGIGLQAWKKEFCDGWWRRKTTRTAAEPKVPRDFGPGEQRRSPSPERPAQGAPRSSSFEKAAPAKPPVGFMASNEKTRSWLVEELLKVQTEANIKEYCLAAAMLLPPGEGLQDLDLRFVPYAAPKADRDKQLALWIAALKDFFDGGEAARPFVNDPNLGEKVKPGSAVEAPKPADDSWREVAFHFGKLSGVTLGAMADDETLKGKLWWWWKTHKVEETFDGHRKSETSLKKDRALRAALDAAGVALAFKRGEE